MPGQTAQRSIFELGASLELGVWNLELVAWVLSFSRIEMIAIASLLVAITNKFESGNAMGTKDRRIDDYIAKSADFAKPVRGMDHRSQG